MSGAEYPTGWWSVPRLPNPYDCDSDVSVRLYKQIAGYCVISCWRRSAWNFRLATCALMDTKAVLHTIYFPLRVELLRYALSVRRMMKRLGTDVPAHVQATHEGGH